MKKALYVTIMLTAISALAGCGSSQTQTADQALSDGVLVVGLNVAGDSSSYVTTDADGNTVYAGAEIEVLDILRDNYEGLEIQYVYADSQAQLTQMLYDGQVELAAGSFTSLDAYTSQFLLSDNYTYGGLYLVGNGNAYIDTLTPYADETVGISNAIPVGNLSEVPGIEVVVQSPYSDMKMLSSDIKSGIAIAGLVTEREAAELMDDTELSITEVCGGPRVGRVFLARPGQESLIGVINTAISLRYDNISK